MKKKMDGWMDGCKDGIIRCLPVFFFVFSTFHSSAQTLTLPDAIATALKNNYSILVAKNEEEAAKNNYTRGNAGFLPSVAATASGATNTNDTKQKYSSGLEINKSGVTSDALSAGVGLNWTLFDGMKMFATYNKLGEMEQKGILTTKIDIENLVAKTIAAYFSIVQEQELLKATQAAIDISTERLRIAQEKFNIGSASKVDFLQAKVDLNEQRSLQMKQQVALSDAKITLNQLLARAADTDFTVSDSIVINYQPHLDDLKSSVAKRNYSLMSAEKDVSISAAAINEMKSQRYPHLGVSGNYLFTKTDNSAGLVLLNQNLGWNVGFNLSWTLFNGFNVSRQVKNATLDYQNAGLALSQMKTEVDADLLRAFNNFQSDLQILRLEEENLDAAKENAAIALERYRVGKSTNIELQVAQKSLEDAADRTVTARYNTKLDETDLMRLNGELVK